MPPAASGSSEAARRLFRAGRPLPGTPAEAYLRARGITGRLDWPALRYHPSVYYREAEDAPLESWPALLAAVTDLDGNITGIQRTWLDPRRPDKAPLADPRRALGHLLGNGVRFGKAADILAAGEGIETMLALKSVLPSLPVIAGLSANHLAALDLPPARLCAASMSPETTTRPVSGRRRGCANAAAPPASKSASSCRSMATSTSISAVSAPRACGRISRISSSPPTGRAFCPIHAAPIRGGEFQRHFGSPAPRRKESGFSFAAAVCLSRKRAAHAAFPSGDLPAAKPGCNGAGQLFSAAGLIIQRIRTWRSLRSARLCIAKQNSCPAPSSALLRLQAPTPRDRSRGDPGGCNPSPPPAKGSP